MRNLNDKIPNAPNFKYKEFVFSKTAIEKNILNIPNEKQWQNIEKLAVNVLQPIRNQFGRISISSGYRSIRLNKEIGGFIYSNHCKGEAADLKSLEGVNLIEITEWIYNNLSFRALIFEFNKWIHVVYRENENIKKLKLKDNAHNYSNIQIQDLKNLYT